jgi:hypothetical protein
MVDSRLVCEACADSQIIQKWEAWAKAESAPILRDMLEIMNREIPRYCINDGKIGKVSDGLGSYDAMRLQRLKQDIKAIKRRAASRAITEIQTTKRSTFA